MANPFLVFTRGETVFFLAVFLLGIIFGAAMLNLFLSQEIDRLVLERNRLKTTVAEQEVQIENLKKYGLSRINKLTIILETDLNQHTQQGLTESIIQLLSGIKGRELKRDELLLLIDIINDRYLNYEGNYYLLKYNWMLPVWGELILNLTVTGVRSGKLEEE